MSAEPMDSSRRTVAGRFKMLLVLLVCAAPVVASYFTYFFIRPEGRTNYAQLILPPRPLPALAMAGLDGKVVEAGSLRGQWLLVMVGGGACDSRCEQYLYLQRQLRESLGREKDRLDKIWFITDGQPPRPEIQNAIQSGNATLPLHLSREELAAWIEPAEGQFLEQHLYLIDPMGNWMLRAPPDPDPAKLKRDVERLLRASASWDLAGR